MRGGAGVWASALRYGYRGAAKPSRFVAAGADLGQDESVVFLLRTGR